MISVTHLLKVDFSDRWRYPQGCLYERFRDFEEVDYAGSRLGPGLRPVHDLFWGQICSLGSTRGSAPNPGVYPLEDTGEVEKQRISSAALHRISCSCVGALSSVALFRCIFSFGTFFGFIRIYTVIFSDPLIRICKIIYINTIILDIPNRFISSATIMLNIAYNEVWTVNHVRITN